MNLCKQQHIKNTWKILWLRLMGEGKGNGSQVQSSCSVSGSCCREMVSWACAFLRSIYTSKSLPLTAHREQQLVGLGTLLTACTSGSLSSVCLDFHCTRRIHLVRVFCWTPNLDYLMQLHRFLKSEFSGLLSVYILGDAQIQHFRK